MIAKRLVFALAVGLALVFSQAPEFAQQYRQRLGGALDELNRFVADFDADARRADMDREAAIARLLGNADGFVRERGDQMRRTVVRLGRLEGQAVAYDAAGPFRRLTLLASNHDREIARRAMERFEPAVPLTSEALAAALLGFLTAWMTGRGLIGLAALRRRSRARARA